MPNESIPQATHSGDLPIGELKIPCFVLADGTRLVSQRGLQRSMGMSVSGGTSGAHRLARFVAKFEPKGLNSGDLIARMESPILFNPPHGGRTVYGYRAEIVPEICEFVLKCRDLGLLATNQAHIAEHSEIVLRAFARVGIIALVDEVTGYQEFRGRRALEEILEQFIDTELHRWQKTFPDEYYREMYRLRNWEYLRLTKARPGVVGRITNDIVYARLAPAVLGELRRRNPTTNPGRRKAKHHQYLTQEFGHPRLREHLASVVALMRASSNWRDFKRMLDRALPKFGDTYELPLDSSESGDKK